MNTIGLITLIQREVERFLRVSVQSLVSPWVSALLYIFIFGFVMGRRIQLVDGVEYIDFVLPGIVMLNVVMSSFSQTSFSLYFQRFARHIEEVLVAPLSYMDMIIGFIAGAMVRSVLVAAGIYIIALAFGAAGIDHVLLMFVYIVLITYIFALLGLIVGMWSNNFEQLSILGTFVLTPLAFLGGMFNTITMFPPILQTIMRVNPIFYFVDGIRYAMIGFSESNLLIGWFVIIGSGVALTFLVWYLFKIGWRIRT